MINLFPIKDGLVWSLRVVRDHTMIAVLFVFLNFLYFIENIVPQSVAFIGVTDFVVRILFYCIGCFLIYKTIYLYNKTHDKAQKNLTYVTIITYILIGLVFDIPYIIATYFDIPFLGVLLGIVYIYITRIVYCFMSRVLLDQERSIKATLIEAARVSRGVRWKIFIYIAVLVGSLICVSAISSVSVVAAACGAFVLSCLITLSDLVLTYIYMTRKEHLPLSVTHTPDEQTLETIRQIAWK